MALYKVAALFDYTDRLLLLLLLWRPCVALGCIRLKEQHVFLCGVVVVVVTRRPGAATIRRRTQRIRRIVLVASIRHLKRSE